MALSKRPSPSPFKVALIGVGLFIVAGIALVVIPAIRNGSNLSHTPLPEHTALFTDSVRDKLPMAFVYKSKIQGAQSNYNLPGDFHLTIYQIALTDNKPLKQILNLNDEKPSQTSEVFSPYQDNSFLKMTKSTSAVDSVSAVYFRYNGPLLKSLIQNDSLACYYLKFSQFSISYNDTGNDIWGLSKTSAPCSISLSFIKKKKTLYIVMLYNNKTQDIDFPADKLYNMLKK
ncbi:MAG: hypothetical protein V4553_06870 [Bacteroidota bacterium]